MDEKRLSDLLRQQAERAGVPHSLEERVLRDSKRRRLMTAFISAVGVAVVVVSVAFATIQPLGRNQSPAAPDEEESSPRPRKTLTVEPDKVLFVYSSSGDIRAQTPDGVVVLTEGSDLDLHPTLSPDRQGVVFERSSVGNGSGPALVYLDLATGDERHLANGTWPSFGPDGRIAWVQPAGAERNEIVISRLFSDPEQTFAAASDYLDVRHITWAPDSSALYYEAGQSIVQQFIEGVVEPVPMTPGGVTNGGQAVRFAAPTMRQDDRVELVRTCCRQDDGGPFAIEIGSLEFTEGGPLYATVGTIDPRFIVPNATEYYVAYVGGLTLTGVEGAGEWSTTGERDSWLVSDGESLYLVDDGGNAKFVSDLAGHEGEVGEYAGIASNLGWER